MLSGSLASRDQQSDRRQLAYAVAARATYFVTRDRELLDHGVELGTCCEITVLRPVDLIAHIDQLRRREEYQPARLAGSNIRKARIGADTRTAIEDAFIAQDAGEKRTEWRSRLHAAMARPEVSTVHGIREAEEWLALYAHDETEPEVLRVPLFRVLRSQSSATIAAEMARLAIARAAENGRTIVLVTEPVVSEDCATALAAAGFLLTGGGWLKAARRMACPTADALAAMPRRHGDVGVGDPVRAAVQALLGACGDPEARLSLERTLSPTKLVDQPLPCVRVTIEPRWAEHLFDADLASRKLFGANPGLMFSAENAYYSKAPILAKIRPPFRVLWYVSRDRQTQVSSIRACSVVEEVLFAPAKAVFGRFRHLGVYTWRDILRMAENNVAKRIVGFRFGLTEPFIRAVPRREFEAILRQIDGKGTQLAGPQPVSQATFLEVYRRGMEGTW